jgi:hypothetical protein
MPLLAMPNEILIKIVNLLPPQQPSWWDLQFDKREKFSSPQELVALMCCSRHLKELAEPVLYSNFSPTGPHAYPFFLRTILRRPELSQFVRNASIHMSNLPMTHGRCAENMEFFTDRDWDLVEISIDHTCTSHPEISRLWQQLIRDGHFGPLVAAIFSLLVNLTNLNVGEFPSESLSVFLLQMIGWASERHSDTDIATLLSKVNISTQPQSLKKLTISAFDSLTIDFISIYGPLFDMSSLTSLTIFGGYWSWTAQVYPSMREVRILESHLSPEGFDRLFKSFPNLEHLSYEHDGRRKWVRHQFALAGPGLPLLPVTQHLRTLRLKFDAEIDDHWDSTTLGSLTSFSSLEHIHVPAFMLLGSEEDDTAQKLADILPASVHVLNLSRCEDDMLLQITEFTESTSLRTPNLEKIILQFDDSAAESGMGASGEGDRLEPGPSPPRAFDRKEAERLRNICEEIGIELEVYVGESAVFAHDLSE